MNVPERNVAVFLSALAKLNLWKPDYLRDMIKINSAIYRLVDSWRYARGTY